MQLLKSFEKLYEKHEHDSDYRIKTVFSFVFHIFSQRWETWAAGMYQEHLQGAFTFLGNSIILGVAIPERFSRSVCSPLCAGSLCIFPALSWHRGGRYYHISFLSLFHRSLRGTREVLFMSVGKFYLAKPWKAICLVIGYQSLFFIHVGR